VLSVVQGFFGGELDLTYTDLQSGISGQVFKSKQPILSLTPDDGIEPEATRERRRQICPGPLIVVPLINKGRVIGTITAINEPNQPAFTSHHVELLMALATQAAAAIENVRLFEETQKARNELEQRIVERTAELAQANVVLKEQIAVRLKAEAEREVLIAELEAKNAELERFTYTVSHDLKSPLITIQGFLGYVEQAALSGDVNRVKADIARITNAASKMKQLLDELLELSRVGRLASPPQEISLDELAHEAMDMVQGRLVEHDVEMLIAPNLPVVYGDLSRLRELLENLLDNAAKYMGDQLHPCIEIGVRRDRPEPVFFVRDNGVGIDPRYHQKIFGLFEKLDHGSEGSGMGLAIIKRIIEVHGGRIWVESEGVGQGSTFCFTLPLPASRE
jgi:signal transduction histidine kinase